MLSANCLLGVRHLPDSQGRRIPLQLRGSAELRQAPQALQQIRLTLPDGRIISLDQVAKLVRTEGPWRLNAKMPGVSWWHKAMWRGAIW